MVAPGPQSRWSGWLLFVDGMTAVVHCVAATYPNTGSPKKKKDIILVIFSPSAVEKSPYSAPACISERTMNSRGPLDDGFARTACFPTWERSPWISMRCALHKRSFLPKIRLRNHQAAQAATVRIFPGCSIFYLFFLAFSRTLPPMNFQRHLFGVRRRHAVGHVIRVVHLTAKHSTEEPGISMDIWDQLRSTGINWDQLEMVLGKL